MRVIRRYITAPGAGPGFASVIAVGLAIVMLASAGARAALPIDATILTVSPTTARAGDSVTWTVRGRPGQFGAIAFSRSSSGGRYLETPLGLGTDAQVLPGFSGPLDASGRLVVTLAVPSGAAAVPYYFQAVVTDDAEFTRNATLSAPATVTVSAAPPQPRGTVTGRVTDVSVAGAPVANAVVEIDGGRFRGVTGPDGRFTIAGVPLGPHMFTTTREAANTADSFYPVTLPNLELRESARELNLTLLRTLVGIPGEPPECPCVITVEAPNVGGAEVTVLIENPFQRFRATATGRSPVMVPFNGPLEEILASRYQVTVSAPGFLSVTLSRVNVPWLLRITVVLPPA